MDNNFLSASILSADFANLRDSIKKCEISGVNWVHIDVMDGHFVPNITMGPFIVEACKQITTLPLDVHLMIDTSEKYAEKFVSSGASWVSIHCEQNPHALQTLKLIRSMGAHPGMAISPDTDINELTPFLPYLDMVLVMTVYPGFSGQKFIPQTVSRIQAARKMLDESSSYIRLEVDGGINSQTIQECAKAGADTFVAASAIFKHANGIKSGVAELRDALK